MTNRCFFDSEPTRNNLRILRTQFIKHSAKSTKPRKPNGFQENSKGLRLRAFGDLPESDKNPADPFEILPNPTRGQSRPLKNL